MGWTYMHGVLTIFLDVLTAAVHNPWHLTVDRIQTQPFVPVFLLLTGSFGWQGELQRLQQA